MRTLFQFRLHHYPLVAAVFCLGIGTAAARVVRGNLDPLWGLIAVVLLSLCLPVLKRKPETRLWTLGALTFVFLGFFQGDRALTWNQDFRPPDSQVVVHATVLSVSATKPGARTLILGSGTVAAAGMPLPGKGRLFLRHNDVGLEYGDRIAFHSRVRRPVNRGNPGEFDWELYNINNKIAWLASAHGSGSLIILRRGVRAHPRALVFHLRETMANFLETRAALALPEDDRRAVRAVLKGIILGDRGELDVPVGRGDERSLSEAFAASGLAHMLSASGLHVGIVVLMVVAGVRVAVRAVPMVLLWLPAKKIAAVAAIPAIVTYCLIVGSRIPAIRAAVIGTVAAWAILCDHKWNSFNILALAALVILLGYPLALFSPGFQLSFAAVAGILLAVTPLWERLGKNKTHATSSWSGDADAYPVRDSFDVVSRLKRHFGMLLMTTMAAGLAALPFLLETFHMFPSYTLFSNLPAGFLLTASLSFGLPATLVGTVVPQLGAVLLVPAEAAVWGIVRIASFFSDLPGSTLSPPSWGNLHFALVLAAAFAVLWYARMPSRKRLWVAVAAACAAACALTSGFWWKGDKNHLTVVFLNVGQADAAFVKAPGSKGLIIDGGIKNRYFDTGKSILLPFLRWGAVSSLDGVVVTHPEVDHMGGVPSVIKDIRPERLWLNVHKISVPLHEQLVDTAHLLKIPIEYADRSCPPVKLGRGELVFLNKPCRTISGGGSSNVVNNASVICRIAYGDISFLFTGDLMEEGEEEILASGMRLDSTVLKVGHHGSRSSSTERFLDRVRPAIAV
ncbi:MAG: ComEC/Rec2 family competence protein, partial [Desulfomonilaceae bacterium]|nr:ComEC/Rec2 family competence protein [Desulfomonilaceae bacterium]